MKKCREGGREEERADGRSCKANKHEHGEEGRQSLELCGPECQMEKFGFVLRV